MGNVRRLIEGRAACVIAAAVLMIGACIAGLAPEKAWAYGVTQTAAAEKSITVAWDDPNAGSGSYATKGYTLAWSEGYNGSQTEVKLPAAQKNYTISGLKPGTKYYVKVRCDQEYVRTGAVSEGYVGSEDVATRVTTPTGVNQVKWWYWAKSVEFGWSKQPAADKVEYKVVRTDKNKRVAHKVENYPSNTYTVNKVKNDVVYTVQMRVHDKWGWSKWSKKAYLFTQPMVNEKKTKVKGKQLTVSWSKIKGATSYTVYASTKEKKGYKKIKTVKASKSSLTFKKIGKTKISPKKKYYVYVVANKKVGKTTYTSGRLYTCQVKGSKAVTRWTF